MKTNQLSKEQFLQRIEFHSNVSFLNETQSLPLYKLVGKSYDYYIKYCFEGNLAKLNFYQQLNKISQLVVPPQHYQAQQIQNSYFHRLFSLSQENKFSIACYFRYYNFNIQSWINYQKECKSVISQQEIIMILKQLLSFQNVYFREYRQCCQVLKPALIYITPQKNIKIYPQSIPYSNQVAVHRQNQQYLDHSKITLDKQKSIETTLTNSQTQQQMQEIKMNESDIQEDAIDIFILICEMISFKKRQQFWSKKHSRILWDSVKALFTSTQVSHLSRRFLSILLRCVEDKYFSTDWLIIEIDKITSSAVRPNSCKTIHFEKNQELASLLQKKAQEVKEQKLKSIKPLRGEQVNLGINKYHSF